MPALPCGSVPQNKISLKNTDLLGSVFLYIFRIFVHHKSGGMEMTEKEYSNLVDTLVPKSPMGKDCFHAFWIGGLICVIGQLFMNGYTALGLEKQDASTAASMSLVALSALLTGLSWYDDIAKHAGAGTLVPITGFANAIAAPAVEFQTEGFVLGVAAKMFTIAGPVIVYGISAGVAYGFLYWLFTLAA
jgi:stage V sporulation protein AC